MYVARLEELYFYKDIIVGNDLRHAALFNVKNRKTEQLQNKGFKIYKLSETEVSE